MSIKKKCPGWFSQCVVPCKYNSILKPGQLMCEFCNEDDIDWTCKQDLGWGSA